MEEESGDTPPALEYKPTVRPEVEWLLEAFWTLSTGRPRGMGVSGIPLVDVEAYCRLAAVYDRCHFVRVITFLDAAYLRWTDQKQSDPKSPKK